MKLSTKNPEKRLAAKLYQEVTPENTRKGTYVCIQPPPGDVIWKEKCQAWLAYVDQDIFEEQGEQMVHVRW